MDAQRVRGEGVVTPQRARSIHGGLVNHVLNRSNVRVPLFRKDHGQPFGSEAW